MRIAPPSPLPSSRENERVALGEIDACAAEFLKNLEILDRENVAEIGPALLGSIEEAGKASPALSVLMAHAMDRRLQEICGEH